MKDNKTRERSRSGTFTLIELLIIVSIIAILATMLLPALSKAREKANTINCASNLKGIGQMAAGYANDYGYILPSRMWTASTTAKTATQLLVDAELIKNVSSQTLGSTESYKNRAYRIFFCEKGSRIDDSSNTGQHGIYGDFGFNYYDGTEIGFQNANKGKRPGQIKNPSGIFMAAEAGGKTGHYIILCKFNSRAADNNTFLHFAFVHNGRANTLFHDTHVASLSRSEVADKTTTSSINDTTFFPWK